MTAPNIVLIITDQQRYPMHWPGGDAWLRELMPNDAELARTGLTFDNAFTASCMCSPSRSTLFTGLYPPRHGVTLTLTHGGARPDMRNLPDVLRDLGDNLRNPATSRLKYLQGFARGAAQRIADSEHEPILRPETQNMPRMLKQAGYTIAYKGKWHLTKPGRDDTWTQDDADHIARAYDFDRWEPPDAGEDVQPERFGGGKADWDEAYTSQAESFLANPPAEPFALVVSLVNPHDVLAYPGSYEVGGYNVEQFRDMGVGLPDTYGELPKNKPLAHALTGLGQTAYLGRLNDERAALDYVNFYAYLHKVVDEKIGRVMTALGDPDDPNSLRSRTMVVRTADHGEMGLSHGGLRQKMFNVYEETIHIPLVVSNPVLFPQPQRTDALASLVDLMPTVASLSRTGQDLDFQGEDLLPVIATASANAGGSIASFEGLASAAPATDVQQYAHFVYDDHKAGTSRIDVTPPPNRIRCVRTKRHKYAVYFDPDARAPQQYELYDLDRDPLERQNLVDAATGAPLAASDRSTLDDMQALLLDVVRTRGTAPEAAILPG